MGHGIERYRTTSYRGDAVQKLHLRQSVIDAAIDEIGLAVAVEIPGAGDPPIGAERAAGDRAAADRGSAVQELDFDEVIALVFPDEIGLAVAVEIPGADHSPTRAERVVANGAAADRRRAVEELHFDEAIALVLPQEIGLAVAVEIPG